MEHTMEHKNDQVQAKSSQQTASNQTNGHHEESQVRVDGQQHEPFHFSDSPSLEQIRRMQEKFSIDRGWCKFHTPSNLLIALTGEIGELSECFLWKGQVPRGCPGWTEKEKIHLGEEMADCLIYLTRLADVCGIDLPAAVERKIGLNCIKYPAEKVFGSSAKYTAYQTPEKNAKDNEMNGSTCP